MTVNLSHEIEGIISKFLQKFFIVLNQINDYLNRQPLQRFLLHIKIPVQTPD